MSATLHPEKTAVDRLSASRTLPRTRVYVVSRLIVVGLVVGSLGSLFWTPHTPLEYVLDIAVRSWLTFLGTVMGHEGSHGHLGRTKSANFWWGRLAFLPTMVPFTNFYKTHNLHHRHTNDPDNDPDHFMNARHAWELPFRALAMPHQWFFWLLKRHRLRTRDIADLVLNYIGILIIFGTIVRFTGWMRVLSGVGPSLFIVSMLLWYPFAFKTHEGFSMGPEEERSHSYYGSFMYWFSFGLSMHREHHMKPSLAWIDLKQFVRSSPERSWRRLLPHRDVRAG